LRSAKSSETAPKSMFFGPHFWTGDLQILDLVFKIAPISDHVAKFVAIAVIATGGPNNNKGATDLGLSATGRADDREAMGQLQGANNWGPMTWIQGGRIWCIIYRESKKQDGKLLLLSITSPSIYRFSKFLSRFTVSLSLLNSSGNLQNNFGVLFFWLTAYIVIAVHWRVDEFGTAKKDFGRMPIPVSSSL